MKRIILLIIGVIVAGIAMGQVNGNFKSVRVINSDSTHGTIPGTIYRGSDLILRWVDENGDIHRFFKTSSGDFWKTTGSTDISGTPEINGLGVPLTFTVGDFLVNAGSNLTLIGSDANMTATTGNIQLNSPNSGITVDDDITLSCLDDLILNPQGDISITPTGSLSISTNGTSRLTIAQNGSWTINGSAGIAGQFLVSTGSTTTPEWRTFSLTSNRLLGRTTAGTGQYEEIQAGTGLTLSALTLSVTNPLSSITAPLSYSGGTLSTSMATNRIIGRTTGGSGVMEELTVTGPLSLSSGALTTSMATNRLIGRSTASTGVMEEIQVGTGLSLSGGTLSSTVSGVSGLTANRVTRAASATTLSDNAGFTWDNTTVVIANQSSDVGTDLNVQNSIMVDDSKIGTNNYRTYYNAGSIFSEKVSGTDDFDIQAAAGTAGSPNGAALIFTSGSGFGSGNTNGGDITVTPGSRNGSGTAGNIRMNTSSSTGGYIIMTGLPTSCAGAPTGSLANIAGVLNICP